MTGKKLLKATGFRSHVLFHHGQLSGEYGHTTYRLPLLRPDVRLGEFRAVAIVSKLGRSGPCVSGRTQSPDVDQDPEGNGGYLICDFAEPDPLLPVAREIAYVGYLSRAVTQRV